MRETMQADDGHSTYWPENPCVKRMAVERQVSIIRSCISSSDQRDTGTFTKLKGEIWRMAGGQQPVKKQEEWFLRGGIPLKTEQGD